MKHKKPKTRPVARLRQIFKELGLGEIPEPMEKPVAIEAAKVEGGSYDPDYRKIRMLGTCDGKLCYASEADARRMKEHRRNKGKVGAQGLRSYHCPKCRHWHLTTQRYHA